MSSPEPEGPGGGHAGRSAPVIGCMFALIAVAVTAAASAQTRPSPLVNPTATDSAPRPVPGPVFESPAFSRAVLRGTRTRTGAPGAAYWVQHPRYDIRVILDPGSHRVSGTETVAYRNFSPDSLRTLAIYLRQNAFAPGSPRRQSVPVTGGMNVLSVAINGSPIVAALNGNPAMPITAAPRTPPVPGQYAIDGTVMWIPLAAPLAPGDSLVLDMSWSYTPAPAPADGREGRDGNVYFMGYWYPQIAVYDDVDGWVTDPYLLEAEFYMDPADYDVSITVPRGWVVGATGTLQNPSQVLSASALDSLAAAHTSGRVVRVVTPGPDAAAAFVPGGAPATWEFSAHDVRDFAWGTSNEYAWDATRALVTSPIGFVNAVDINAFYRLTDSASAWRIGGARFTRDAIQQLSSWLWPYPWPQMTSMEGVLDSGGMEYPMMTLMQPWADTLSLAGDLMHETGHMWFPMQVGSNETRYPWMDEGLTQFDVAQAMRALYGSNRTGGRPNDSERGQRMLYLGAVRAGDDEQLMLPGDEFPQDRYLVIYYDKTAQILAALRAIIGPDVLHRALITYGRSWTDRHPQPYDFFNAISAVAGRDLSWFWSTWFYHAWSLDQAIDTVTPVGVDSLAITIGDHGLAPMPVLLAVTRTDGSVQRMTIPVDVWLNGSRRTTLTVSEVPAISRIEIDPDSLFPDIDRGNQVVTFGPGGAVFQRDSVGGGGR
jgi:Peptidase family M1 domain